LGVIAKNRVHGAAKIVGFGHQRQKIPECPVENPTLELVVTMNDQYLS
jgi:hypothetical protein